LIYKHVLLEARREFAGGDPGRMASLSGADYVPERHVVKLCYLNAVYEVSFPDGEIAGDRAGELDQDEEALLLQYLSQASGSSLTGRWIAFAELPSGMLHDAPFRVEAIRPLAQFFDQRPQHLIQAARQLGGQPIRLTGDVGVVIPVLPQILLAVFLWVGDEEFPARANMLFDAVSPGYLSTASLFVLGSFLSVRLRQIAGTLE
jgi:hypothetical protein